MEMHEDEMGLSLEYWLQDRKELQRTQSDCHKRLGLSALHLEHANNHISRILLKQYGLERGTKVIITNEIQQYIWARHWAQFAIGETIFVDGMEEARCHDLNDYPPQCEYIIILTDKMDGYTPFSDFNLSSSVLATGEIGNRVHIPLEYIVELESELWIKA